MKRKLRAELVKLCTDVITSREQDDIDALYHQARGIYEKLAVLRFIEDKLTDVEVDVSKSDVASKFEIMASAVLKENKSVPETNPHEEDIITPGMDTIRHMVSEMPGGEELEDVLERLLAQNDFVKNDKQEVTPKVPQPAVAPAAKSLNDTLTTKEISVGLNDRLAFVKHLFNDNPEAYGRILAELNRMETQESSLEFIRRKVKPEFNHWEGKDEYEARFLALIERRFN